MRAPGGGSAGSLQGPSAAAAVLSPIPAETAPKIIQLRAVDRVAVATGPKLFVDRIEADIGRSYGAQERVEAQRGKWPPLAATGTPLKECQWRRPRACSCRIESQDSQGPVNGRVWRH